MKDGHLGTVAAHTERMSPIRPLLLASLMVAGCYSDQAYTQGTFPQAPQDPQPLAGPPGGGMDPEWGYQDPGYATDSTVSDPEATAADPSLMGAVNDTEIDTTLQPYGEWVQDEDYGRVWRPYATVVGADFTPYETCGSWLYTDYGWTYSCDWDWGWLPFHYGQWAWMDTYWGWVPGYEWSPAWVDWRSGGGYVGWRPHEPVHVRGDGWVVRDHRHHTASDMHWRFTAANDFGGGHIHGKLINNLGDGLRATQPGARPTWHPVQPQLAAAQIMHARALSPEWTRSHPIHVQPGTPAHAYQPPVQNYRPAQQPRSYGPPVQSYQQPYRAPVQSYQPPVRSYQPAPTYRQPMQSYQPPVRSYQPAPTYRPPVQTYHPAPAYHAPVQSYHPAPSYSAPSHSSYSAPSHSYSAPSHSSSSGGGGHHR